MALSFAGSAGAKDSHVVVVTPDHQHGWTTADTRPGGAVTFVADSTAPRGNGALQLTTDLTTTAKAQYMHGTNTPLADVTQLSYWTKQISPSPPVADPSYQVAVCLLGPPTATNCPGFTTLVYEPYQGGQGAVLPDVWQYWNIDSTGLFWSTRTVTCPGGLVVGTPGGPSMYTLAQIKTICPNAVVSQFGVNIGSNNPGYVVRTDVLNFNGTVYDFESARGHHGEGGGDQGDNGQGDNGQGDNGQGDNGQGDNGQGGDN